MNWAVRRRIIIVLVVLAFLSSVTFYKLYPIIFKPALCTDLKQNGGEVGVDCGGPCNNFCAIEIKIPTLLWSRSFPVTDTVYNAVAYVENKNNAATKAIPYEFRLYDNNGILISRVDGVTLIPPLGRYAIVETGIKIGGPSVIVARTTFEFSSRPALWEKVPKVAERINVLTSDIKLDTSGTVPKLSATIYNPSPTVTLQNTVVAAILYDEKNNAVNTSRTIVPVLEPGAKTPIYFTWPRSLSAPIVRFELLPIIDVFNTQ